MAEGQLGRQVASASSRCGRKSDSSALSMRARCATPASMAFHSAAGSTNGSGSSPGAIVALGPHRRW